MDPEKSKAEEIENQELPEGYPEPEDFLAIFWITLQALGGSIGITDEMIEEAKKLKGMGIQPTYYPSDKKWMFEATPQIKANNPDIIIVPGTKILEPCKIGPQ